MHMSRWYSAGSARLASVVLMSLSVLACQQAEEDAPTTGVRPVKFVTVEAADGVESRSFPARIGALQSSQMGFRVGGQIETIEVAEGQEVEQGDVIARLDQRDFRSELTSAQAQYNTAEAEYQRALQLAERGTISQSTVDQRRATRGVALSGLQAVRDAIEDTELRAPFGGVIALVHADPFQIVQPSEPIVTLQSTGDMEAIINIPSTLVARAPSRELTSALVRFEDIPDLTVEARFNDADLSAGDVSQTYRVSFAFTPPPQEELLILPGMNATIELQSIGRDDGAAVVIPTGAISQLGEDTFVWIIDPDTMAVSRRTVTLDDSVGETIVVTDGLEAGEVIAGAGASHLSEGMVVRPWVD